MFDNATIRYTGDAVGTDRLFSIGPGGCVIEAAGSGGINFSNSGSLISTGSGIRTLILTGTTSGNVLTPVVPDDGTANPTSVTKTGTGAWTLSGANSYTGALTVDEGTLIVSTIRSGGQNCNVGASPNDAANLVIDGGTLLYTGNGNLSDRLFTIGAGGATLEASGAGALQFTNSDPLDISGTGTRNLTLTGSNAGDNTISQAIDNDASANATSVTKSGAGTWILSGDNTYTGTTTVSSGTFIVNGSTAAGSAVNVNSGTFAGSGNTAGTVSVAAGVTVCPGDRSAGTLSTGRLILNNTSILDFELGTQRDSINVTGNLTLDGILNVTGLSGFSAGVYCIVTYTGTLTNNGLSLGSMPSGYDYIITASGGKVELNVIRIELKPLTVVQTAQRCSVYTDDFTLVFDNSAGGGITTLTDGANGSSSGQGNQIGAGQNLYYFHYDGASSKTNGNGTWSVLKQENFYTIVRQSGTLGGLPYVTDYTVHGSGKVYIRTTLYNNTVNPSSGITRCVTERRSVATTSALRGNDVASQCPYLLISSDSSKQSDILLSTKDLWNTASGAPNSATGFYTGAGYNGYEHNSLSVGAGQRQSWEFMLDFIHYSWNDTTGTGKFSDDYRTPDSLEMISGTLLMENAWENHLRGHWRMNDGAGDTAHDNSGNNRHAKTTGIFTESGRWSGALTLSGAQNVTYPDNSDFDGVDFFTVIAWIKLNSGAFTSSAIIAGKHNGTNGWKLTGNGSDQVVLTCNGTAITGVKDVGDANWHHVAVCFSPEKVLLFVDGQVDKVSNGNYSVTSNNSALIIGGGLAGVLDDVRYYHDYLSENTLKAVYQKGFRSSEGMYELRADNNNTVHLKLDGGSVPRNFPVFHIHNYWAASKPAAGCVRLNGITLVENADYYADFDDTYNLLTIGLNKTISSNGVLLYIDDGYANGYQVTGTTKKMSWGVQDAGSYDHFWVKNFSGSNFGSNTSNEWYVNWKMSKDNATRQGEIWHMASSVKNPMATADTASTTNLIPGDPHNSTMGNLNFTIGGAESKSSEDVQNAFSYAVEESSSVRILLRVNERIVTGTQTFRVVTRWAIYPTGQFFRYDSLYQFQSAPTVCKFGLYMDDQTNASIYLNKYKKRAGIIYSSGLPDFASSWLSFKNAAGYQEYPFNSDTIISVQNADRIGFDYTDNSLPVIWNSPSIETAFYFDMQKCDMSNGFVDSVANGVQYIGLSGKDALSIITGTLLTETQGDLNKDGFNEREGAYVIGADNNLVNFKLPARNDTCRFYPVFRITDYYASSKPEYVFLYNSTGDTVPLVEGYQYNVYINRISRELILQIDSIFCDSVGIFISSDRTLAIKMSGFWAKGGIGCDTIGWRTESEQENLGFYLYRRVKPFFFQSYLSGENNLSDSVGLASFSKQKIITATDTGWLRLNRKIISGANSGASYGPRNYSYIDRAVLDSVLYEYKLIAVDYSNKEEEFGPVEAIPSKKLLMFSLRSNYPNPFRHLTVIRFEIPMQMRVSLNIYNLQGRLVRRLVTRNKILKTALNEAVWDGRDDSGQFVSNGPYIYRLTAERFVASKVLTKLE